VLWQARIYPLRKLEDLGRSERDRLFEALQRVLAQWVEHYGVDISRSLTHFRDLPGGACPRCRAPLVRIRAGGRTSLLCPTCQPAPRLPSG
jgi:formamidopyrimidine-DNA glycosylase